MNNEESNIYFRIKYKKESRTSRKSVILLEPSSSENLDNYKFDIQLLSKDFEVHEISEDLHFVYESDIKDFFVKHSEAKISQIPPRLWILNDAAEEVVI